jgi:hypothetical protein
MQSSKKSTKVLSALTMAAAAAVSARATHAVTLSMYYGSDINYSNSNNGIFVANSYNPSSSSTNAHNQPQFLGGVVTPVIPNSGGPTTIFIVPGEYLSISIDAVLTGNPNAAAGSQQAGDLFAQPSFLGLAELGLTVASSDVHGTVLTPFSTDTQVETTIGGLASYNSTAIINTDSSPAPQSGVGTNDGGGYNAVPKWTGVSSGGLVQPNLPGYDTAPNSLGSVGFGTSPTSGAFPAGGNTNANARTSTANVLEAFGSASNTASYASATDFLDSLTFQALTDGSVTLTPTAISQSSEYWQYNGNLTVTGKTTSSYTGVRFGAGDTVNPLPSLVIDVVAVPEPATVGLLTLGAIGLLARRNRGSKTRVE